MKKKILIFVVLILIVIIAGLWHVRSKKVPLQAEMPSGFSFFGLFGETRTATSLPNVIEEELPAPEVSEPQAPLRQLVGRNVVSAHFFMKGAGTSTEEVLRYVDRETGHIFEISVDTGERLRISNITIPRIQEAVWGDGGEVVALQYLDDEIIRTYVRILSTTTDEVSLPEETDNGFFLPQNITSLSISPSERELFYLREFDESSGFISSVPDSEIRPVFRSPLKQLVSQWTSSGIHLTTKAAQGYIGMQRSISLAAGSDLPLIMGVPGLMTRSSPSGQSIVYTSTENGLSSFIFKTNTKESLPLSLSLLPEKCTWYNETLIYCGLSSPLPDTRLPDMWYQGRVSLDDSLWEINALTGTSTALFSQEETHALEPANLDIIKPVINSTGTLLAFINKTNDSLWLADLEEIKKED